MGTPHTASKSKRVYAGNRDIAGNPFQTPKSEDLSRRTSWTFGENPFSRTPNSCSWHLVMPPDLSPHYTGIPEWCLSPSIIRGLFSISSLCGWDRRQTSTTGRFAVVVVVVVVGAYPIFAPKSVDGVQSKDLVYTYARHRLHIPKYRVFNIAVAHR